MADLSEAKKIVVEIEASKFKISVLSSGESPTVLSSRSFNMHSRGHSRGIEKGDFFDDFGADEDGDDYDNDGEIGNELCEALDDLHSGAFDAAGVLWRITEEIRGEEVDAVPAPPPKNYEKARERLASRAAETDETTATETPTAEKKEEAQDEAEECD